MMVKPFAVFLLGKATSLCLNIIRPEPLLLIQNVLFRSRVLYGAYPGFPFYNLRRSVILQTHYTTRFLWALLEKSFRVKHYKVDRML